MNAEFHLKRVYDPPGTADGARVLVDRLWPRGVTKQAAALTLWAKDVAPSAALRQWFGHEPSRWPEFQLRYRTELRQNSAALEPLYELLRAGPVTLLYGAHDTAHNHAVVLAEYLHAHRAQR